MRVLYIHQYFCTRAGRSGTRSYEFARQLVLHGHQVTMLTSTSDLSDLRLEAGQRVVRSKIEGIDVVAVAVGYSQQMSALGRIRSFLRFMVMSSWLACRERAHDVVIATSPPLTVGIPGMLVSRLRRIPLVFEVRDLWPESLIQMGGIRNPVLAASLRFLERLIYRCSRHVIALSPGMRDGIIAAGTPASKITVIPNCSDLDLFQPGPPSETRLRALGLTDSFVAVYTGSMGQANDIDLLVDAAAELQEHEAEPIKFLLVGQGAKCEEVLQRVRTLGLRNVVFAGSVPRQDVPELLRLGNVSLVLLKNIPVHGTASPNKLFDSLAAGRPLVVNCSGWIRELVERHRVGVWAEPGSSRSLAERLVQLARNPRLVDEMAGNARRLAEEEFDRLKLAGQFERVLLQAANQHEAPPSPSEVEREEQLEIREVSAVR